MSNLKNNISNKSNTTNPKKSYHFFNIPSTILFEGEINKVVGGVSKKIYFTLFEEDFLFYEVYYLKLLVYLFKFL